MTNEKTRMEKAQDLLQENVEECSKVQSIASLTQWHNEQASRSLELFNRVHSLICVTPNNGTATISFRSNYALGAFSDVPSKETVDISFGALPDTLKLKFAEWVQEVCEYNAVESYNLLSKKNLL